MEFCFLEQFWFYQNYWQFNSPLDKLIRFFIPSQIALVKLALLGILGVFIFRKRTWNTGQRASVFLLGALFLHGALYPWYLLWILPFAVENPGRNKVFFYLAALLPLSYQVLIRYHASGIWQESRKIDVPDDEPAKEDGNREAQPDAVIPDATPATRSLSDRRLFVGTQRRPRILRAASTSAAICSRRESTSANRRSSRRRVKNDISTRRP